MQFSMVLTSMLPEVKDLAEDALQDVSYLTRSRNRVQILGAVARNPISPRELAELTGASRSTLQRILSELEDRQWVRRTPEGSYVTTPVGTHVVNELVPFVESMETIDELGEAVAALPTESLPIGIQHFMDATVIRPAPNDPNAPGAYFTTSIRETAELRCVVDLAAPLALEKAMRERVADGVLQSEHVLTDRLFRYNCQYPERAQTWKELTQSGADVYRYDGDISCNVFILDETVLLGETPPDGEGCVLIETEKEPVLEWAHEFVEEHRKNADPLTGQEFVSDQAPSKEHS